MTINTTKYVFRVSEVSFLGHLFSGKGLAPLPQKVETIVNFLQTQDVKGLRRFSDMINFYNKFLSNITNTQAALQEVIKSQKKGNQIFVE